LSLGTADGQQAVTTAAGLASPPPLVLLPRFVLDRLGEVAGCVGEGNGFDGRFAVDLGVLFEGPEAFFGHPVATGLVEQVG